MVVCIEFDWIVLEYSVHVVTKDALLYCTTGRRIICSRIWTFFDRGVSKYGFRVLGQVSNAAFDITMCQRTQKASYLYICPIRLFIASIQLLTLLIPSRCPSERYRIGTLFSGDRPGMCSSPTRRVHLRLFHRAACKNQNKEYSKIYRMSSLLTW
jgi:hypothetical protein